MTGWWTQPMCGFDVETTGIDVEADRIVSACFVNITPAERPPWGVDAASWIINPGVPIPDEAARIHGITTERAQAEGRPPRDALNEVAGALARALADGRPIVGMNVPFDLTVLDRECRRHGLPPLTERAPRLRPFVDVYVLDKKIDQFRRGKRTLEALCRHYNVRLDGAHDAVHDTVAACRLAWRIVTSSRPLMNLSLDDLHDQQVAWRAFQQAGLREYFLSKRKQAEADSVNVAWPILPWPD